MATMTTDTPPDTPPAKSALRFGPNGRRLAGQIALAAGLILLWQWLAAERILNPFYYSQPSAVAERLADLERSGRLWWDIGHTLLVLALGWGLAVTVGGLLGIALGLSRTLQAVLDPYLVFFNAFPRFLLLPFFMIWLGFGLLSQVVFVFTVAFVVIALTVEGGIRGIDAVMLQNARVLGARRRDLVLRIYLPAAGLWLLASARTTVGFALHAALFAEFFGTSMGLGYLLTEGRSNLDAAQVFAVIIVVTIVGFLADLALARVERVTTRWVEN